MAATAPAASSALAATLPVPPGITLPGLPRPAQGFPALAHTRW
jgi:hypothetical protein